MSLTPEQQDNVTRVTGTKTLLDAKLQELQGHAMMEHIDVMRSLREQAHALLDAHMDQIEAAMHRIRRSL